jgi:hypothetical protein
MRLVGTLPEAKSQAQPVIVSLAGGGPDAAADVGEAHATGGLSLDMHTECYPLWGLMYCICGQVFVPWGWAEEARTYQSLCGCRLRPIDAAAVERRVKAVADLPNATSPFDVDRAALQRMYARIEIGGTDEDLRVVPRT